MTENERTLTTAQYSEKTGIAIATVARMLRQGKLRGVKRGGKWAIFESELQGGGIQPPKTEDQVPAVSNANADTQAADGNSYDIESFARLTYLTENGVRQWLRMGRLSGTADAGDNARVDASNLQRPDFKHLVRQ